MLAGSEFQVCAATTENTRRASSIRGFFGGPTAAGHQMASEA